MRKKSNILKTVHKSAKSLLDLELIDKITMREFDALCMPSIKKLSPKEIKKIRQKEKLSQPIFAKFLNVSPSTIKKWETGEKTPTGASLQLLNIVKNNGLKIFQDPFIEQKKVG